MPEYKCEIQMPSGEAITETVNAGSLMEASQWARNKGGHLLNVTPAAITAYGLLMRIQNARLEPKPSTKDVMNFTKQLAVMIKAGIGICDAIEGITGQVDNSRWRKVLEKIRGDVESGTSFSAALSKHPKIFSSLYVNMVRASEMSGSFAHMLDRIALYLNQQQETRRMVRGAMIYPMVLLFMSVVSVIFLLTWVLPKFMVMFAGKEELLPAATSMLLAISRFMQHQWYILVAVVAVVVVGLICGLRTPQGREYLDRFKLRAPILKRMFRSLYITRSLQAMGELTNAGVPILDSLSITAEISGNILYKRTWMKVRESVEGGNKIVHYLLTDGQLPKSVIQMISAGEESGRLGEVLSEVSEFYAKELKDTIKAVTGLIEPIMIVVMGGVVGFIAMSIILPVFSMSKLVK